LKLLSECHGLERGALDSFWDEGNRLEYCRTYNELAKASYFLFFREWDQQARREVLEERLSWGERTIAVLPELGDSYEAGRTRFDYFDDLWILYWYIESSFQLDEGMRSRVFQHVDEALKFAVEVGDDYTTGLCYIHLEGGISDSSERRLNYLKTALEYGEKTRDIYLKAIALGYLAYGTYWRAFRNEDPDQRIETADEAMEFYDRAQNLLTLLSFQIPPATGKIRRPAPGGYAEYYLDRATWETDPKKKMELLDKSEKDGLKALTVAKAWGDPLSISWVSHVLSRALMSRARLETDLETKRGLLVRAGEHRERNIEIAERLGTLWYWNQGIIHYYLAQIKKELSLIEPDPDV